MQLTLLGTTTSPFTRKLRIALGLAGLDHSFLDSRTDEGGRRLAEVAPLGKVPALIVDAPDRRLVLADSNLGIAWLGLEHHAALLAKGADFRADLEDEARRLLVSGALDAAINRFYLLRDGFADQHYIARQATRVEVALTAIAKDIDAFTLPPAHLRPSSLELACGLDWLRFRNVVDLSRWPALLAFLDRWHDTRLGQGTEPG